MFDHRKYRPAPTIRLPDRTWPDRTITHAPRWASVDLRDGNQALLAPMNVAQKQALWRLLLEIGLKEIEVGFPSASQPDHDFVRWLIEERQIPDDVTIQVLTQAREELIQRTFAALDGVPRAIVHVYNSTSPVQREWVFGTDRAGVKAIAAQGAELVQQEAAKYPGTDWTFQYSPESFSQTEPDYAVEVVNAVIDVWQPTPERPCIINLPATVESTSPNLFADQVEWFCRHVARRDAVVVSLHTHNDRGGAAAAAELGLLAGADRLEGTLLGNGERTGNMDLITVAMNLYSQGVDPRLDLSNPDRIIDVTEQCTGIACHPRHPWVGELVYTAFSGSHQDAIGKSLRHQRADKGGIAFVLERDFGLNLPRWMQQALAPIVQQESERRGGVIDAARIHALFREHFVRDQAPARLTGYRLNRNGHDGIEARIRIDGAEQRITGSGDGTIAAFADAWKRAFGTPVNVLDYQEHAIGAGTDAEAAAYVLLDVDGRQVPGAALDTDTLGASLKAVLSALNRAGGGAGLQPAVDP